MIDEKDLSSIQSQHALKFLNNDLYCLYADRDHQERPYTICSPEIDLTLSAPNTPNGILLYSPN